MQYGNSVYDGIEIFMLEDNKPLKWEVNKCKSELIMVKLISNNSVMILKLWERYLKMMDLKNKLFSLMNY